METLAPARTNGYAKLIAISYKLYKKSLAQVFLLSLLLSFVVFIPRFTVILTKYDILQRGWNWFTLVLFAIQFIAIFLFIGIIWHVYCIFHGKKDRLAKDFNVGVHKVISVAVAGIIQNLAIIGVSLLVFAFQVYLASQQLLFNNNLLNMIFTIAVFSLSMFLILYLVTLFAFLIPLIAIENKNVFAALNKSISLGWNHWWRIFSVQLTPWIIYAFVLAIIRYAFHIDFHIYFVSPASDSIGISIAHMLIFAIFIPFIATTMVVQLNDLEQRVKPIRIRIRKQRKKR